MLDLSKPTPPMKLLDTELSKLVPKLSKLDTPTLTNQGPAPADTVTVTKIAAPARTHTHITPQVTRVEPELKVNKYTVEVPVAVPVPVEREVIVEKHVAKPYPVEVPQPYAVPQPYK